MSEQIVNRPSISVGVVQPTGMSFPDAMREVIAGNCVTRLEWNNVLFFVLLKDGQLQLHKPDGKFYTLIVTDGDMIPTDWVVC